MFIKSTSLIIPTKERLKYLIRFFKSIESYTSIFNEILIVDSSSSITHRKIKDYFKKKKNIKIIKSEPSSSVQRNLGIIRSKISNKYLMFCDDDIIFKKNSIKNMDKFIKNNSNNIGFGFNLVQKIDNSIVEELKKNKFFSKNGFYNHKPGVVCANGWHTKITNAKKDYNTMWLSTQACIYQKKYIHKVLFDTHLGKYSYLEDLFFSFELSKKGNLIISSDAKYTHPDNIERNNVKFGIQEVVNRYKFVKKNKLNLGKFFVTIFIKLFINFIKIFTFKIYLIPKSLGNIIGIFICFLKLN